MSPEEVAGVLGVSRETLDRLSAYVDLLEKWQRRINLVSAATLEDVWRRHILDCGQLVRHLPPGAQTLVDLGSGAGLPGLIVAILTGKTVDLIESDARKCAFLLEAQRITGAPVAVRRGRGEEMARFYDVVVARALAPLPRLLALAEGYIDPKNTVCLFLKGRDVAQELTEAAKDWIMDIERIASLSDPQGSILRLRGVRRRHQIERTHA